MYLKMTVPECDFTGEKFPNGSDGCGCLAQGATGRVCVVMYMGKPEMERQGIIPLSYNEAEQYAESLPNGWLDA